MVVFPMLGILLTAHCAQVQSLGDSECQRSTVGKVTHDENRNSIDHFKINGNYPNQTNTVLFGLK